MMTSGKTMKENIEAWVSSAKEANPDVGFEDEDLKEMEELSLDKMSFKDNTITTAEWREMVTSCPNCEAFSAVECGIENIEEPQGEFEFAGYDEETDEPVTESAPVCARIQVLDLSKNELKSLKFLKGFPNLISLSVSSSQLKSEEDFQPLTTLESLQMLEVGDEVPEDTKTKLWTMLPNLSGLNNKDQEGNDIAIDELADFPFEEEGLEEEGDFPYEEEDDDFIDDELEEEEDGELEEGEEEEEEEGDDEPAAKRTKTD